MRAPPCAGRVAAAADAEGRAAGAARVQQQGAPAAPFGADPPGEIPPPPPESGRGHCGAGRPAARGGAVSLCSLGLWPGGLRPSPWGDP